MTEHEPQDTAPRRLNPWNPLDHLRLLWWVLVMPQRLMAYREAYGENAERSVDKWLASTLGWLPIFVPTLALGLETFFYRSTIFSNIYIYRWVAACLALAWFLTGLFGRRGVGAGVGMSFVMAAEVLIAMIALAIGIDAVDVFVFPILFVVLFGVAHVLAIGTERSLEKSLKTGRSSWLVRGVFGAMLLANALLIWFSFLGGWQVF